MIYTIILIVTLVLVSTTILSPLIGLIYWYRKGVSTVSPISLFGYLANIIFKKEPLFKNLQDFYTAMRENGKQYGGYIFFMKPIFVPTDLNLIKNMLINDFDHFTDHIGHVDAENDPLTLHLFNAKGWHWRKIRSKLTSSFTSAKLKIMFDTTLKCGQDLKQLIDNCVDSNESINIKDVSERFTTDVIVSYGFGVDSKALRNNTSEFRRLLPEVADSFRVLLAMLFPDLLSLLKIKIFNKNLSDLFTNLVEETAKYRKENGIVREDFMHQLLQSRNSDESEIMSKEDLSLNEIAAQCLILYGAGYETTAAAISYTLTELALNQGIQNKVRDEIRAVLEKHNGRITYEAVQEMEYLNSCLHESLRMYPPVPTNTRLCTKSYKIPNSDVVINKGTYVFIPIYALHRDPEFFPNPDKYNPDRFAKEKEKSLESPAFMPFGGGPRKCIGYKFGIINALVPLVILIKHFKIYPHPDVKVPFRFSTTFFLNTLNPLKVIAEKFEE